jgi:hypothetical protein
MLAESEVGARREANRKGMRSPGINWALPDAPQVETVRSNGSDLEMVESLRLDLKSGVGWTSDPDGAVRVVVG